MLDRRGVEPQISADTRDRARARLQRRRAITLIVMTLVVPGSAQLVAGDRRLGRFALRVVVTAVVVAVLVGLLALVSRSAAITVVSHRWVLAVLEWALYGFAVLWAILIVDAWRLGRPQDASLRTRRWLAVMTAAALLAPAATAYAGRSVGAVRDAVVDGLRLREGSSTRPAGRYNILLLGGDSGANRVGTRPDSIQLASVDADTGRAVLFGFSRETEHIRFREGSVMSGLMPEGWTCGDECLLNGSVHLGTREREAVPRGHGGPRSARDERSGRGPVRAGRAVLRPRRPQGL